MADPGPFKRPLYPPSHDKGPVPNGDDIQGVKRAISRAGFWEWGAFDAAYNEAFARGGDKGTGVKGFQKSVKIDATGNYGSDTHSALKKAKNKKGESAFDATAAELYKKYKVPVPPPPVGIEDFREFCVEFCNKGLANASRWKYSQNRPVKVDVDPSGNVTSDCSGSVIQITYYGRKRTGLAIEDPSKQNWTGYGNTDLYEDDWPTVTGSYQIGDLAHYSGHVTFCMKAGDWSSSDWWSFGSEPPSKRKLNYRSDFRKVVRPKYLP